MPRIEIKLTQPRPFFPEIPHYLWGQVNYDSEGDCGRPTDQEWNFLQLENRDTRETVEIQQIGGKWMIEGEAITIARVGVFLEARSGGGLFDRQVIAKDPNHVTGLKWARAVALEFQIPELRPFDSHDFWGSWKWIGWFGTDFTWIGRWIMHAVARKDTRAVSLCIYWLKSGTYSAGQSSALRYALNRITRASFSTDKEWIRWYEGGLFSRGTRIRYPEANIDDWLVDIKKQTAALLESIGQTL